MNLSHVEVYELARAAADKNLVAIEDAFDTEAKFHLLVDDSMAVSLEIAEMAAEGYEGRKQEYWRKVLLLFGEQMAILHMMQKIIDERAAKN